MSNTFVKPGKTRARAIAFWILRIVLGLMFLGAAGFKLSGHPAAVSEFDLVGLGQWFRYFTAASEIIGALLLLWPRTTVYGAVLLAALCIGAFVAQIVVLHGDVIHTIVLTGVFVAIAWAHRDRTTVRPLKPIPQP